MITYPLLHILLYLAILFAPPETRKISITGPGLAGPVELTLNAQGWQMQQKRISIEDGHLLQQGSAGKEDTDVRQHVPTSADHDWNKSAILPLPGSATLEKVAGGFIFHLNPDDHDQNACHIAYEPPAAAVSTATLATGTITVNVLGEINKPGAYEIPASGTLVDALATAGGWTKQASLQKISLLRGAAGAILKASEYNVRAILNGTAPAPVLQDRDTIYVPESAVVF